MDCLGAKYDSVLHLLLDKSSRQHLYIFYSILLLIDDVVKYNLMNRYSIWYLKYTIFYIKNDTLKITELYLLKSIHFFV